MTPAAVEEATQTAVAEVAIRAGAGVTAVEVEAEDMVEVSGRIPLCVKPPLSDCITFALNSCSIPIQ